MAKSIPKQSAKVFPTNRGIEERMFSEQDLRRLIIPLVIEQFLALFIGMADTVMVSTVSESAVSAISLVDSINVLLIQLFSAMATGGAVVAAQYLGRRDNLSACNAAKQLMYVSTLLAAALGVVAGNPQAEAFWRKNGFEFYGEPRSGRQPVIRTMQRMLGADTNMMEE